MINIRVVCVGNLKEEFWREACQEYAKRLGRFCKLSVIEVAEQNKFDNIDKIVQHESREILNNLEGFACLLDIKGRLVSSEDVASLIEEKSLTNSTITFVIGGSYGVSQELKEKIPTKISFGRATFPHNLARVILLEQVYRGFMINSGGKYHK